MRSLEDTGSEQEWNRHNAKPPPVQATVEVSVPTTPYEHKKSNTQNAKSTALSRDTTPPGDKNSGIGTLSWLHLADLGFCAAESYLPDQLKRFETDVIAKLVEQGDVPDLVLISGDITRNGSAEDFTLAEKHMRNWAEKFGHQVADSWFLVPGDRDVNHASIELFQKGLRDMLIEQNVDNLLAAESTWAQFAARQAPFLSFTKRFFGTTRAWSLQAPWRTDIFSKGDLRLAILCLNTAWCAQDEQDRGNLLIGRRQLDDAFSRAEDAHLRLALLHHPTTWLKPFEATSAHTRLTGNGGCSLIFFADGDTNPTSFNSAGNKGHHFSASLRPDPGRDALISFGKLNLYSGEGRLQTWTYSEKDNGFWMTANLSRHMPDGMWTFSLEPLNKPVQSTDEALSEQQSQSARPTIPNRYQRFLNNRFGILETLARMDEPDSWRLRNVYVPLQTYWLEPGERGGLPPKDKRIKIALLPNGEVIYDSARDLYLRFHCKTRPLTELAEHPTRFHFLIEGHPGGGKSTFLRYLALKTLDTGAAVPILLSIKDFGTFLGAYPGEKSGLLLRQWAVAALGSDYDVTEAFLKKNHGRLLWLLDGLDEIFDTHRRLQAAEIIGNWCRGQGDCDRVLITSRPHALEQPGIINALGQNDMSARVLSLDEESQKQFLCNWFGALYGAEEKDKAQELQAELWHALESQTITADMRDSPLLLSIMATIYHQGRTLPERRADLYERAIDLILARRFGPGHQGGGSSTICRMRLGLEEVALSMQKAGSSREIARVDFLHYLTKGYFPNHEPSLKEQEELEALAERLECHSGILEVNPESSFYGFAHNGYQEFLAARCLAKKKNPFKEIEAYLDQDSWREVILLMAGYLFQSEQSEKGISFLQDLRTHCGIKSDCARLSLVVLAAAEAPKGSMVLEVERSIKQEAVALIESGEGEEQDRAKLGLALGRLGDPRIDVLADFHWVRFDIPKGWKDDRGVTVTEPRAFYMARYPVTNGEYALFLKDGGYEKEEWWSEEGLLWKDHHEKWLDRFELTSDERFEPGNKPGYWADWELNEPNQPVVGVSYYEAEAYCAWLTHFLKQGYSDKWPSEWHISLPNSTLWFFAAAGPNLRKYPWGDHKWGNKYANFDLNLEQLTSVGLYPKGATPEGLFDMAGNVSEWCVDRDKPNTPHRMLCGSSWFDKADCLVTSERRNEDAGHRCLFTGFRLVVLLPCES